MIEFIASARKFIESEDAPTMVEYGLLVALIALVVAAAAATFGRVVSWLFDLAAVRYEVGPVDVTVQIPPAPILLNWLASAGGIGRLRAHLVLSITRRSRQLLQIMTCG